MGGAGGLKHRAAVVEMRECTNRIMRGCAKDVHLTMAVCSPFMNSRPISRMDGIACSRLAVRRKVGAEACRQVLRRRPDVLQAAL